MRGGSSTPSLIAGSAASGAPTDAVPDHSIFSKNRHGRFRDSDLLRQLFEATVERCMAVGIVGGQGFAVDASMIRADAHRQQGVPSREELDPENTSRAVTEYLAVLDDAAFGAATEVAPKFVSLNSTRQRVGLRPLVVRPCYADRYNYLIDVEHAVIVDVEATTAVRQAEVRAAQTMLTRTAERFGLWPERLIADTGYGSAAMLDWLVHEQGIEPHIPVFDKSTRKDGTFSRSDFAYYHQRDLDVRLRAARNCCITAVSSNSHGSASMPKASCVTGPACAIAGPVR